MNAPVTIPILAVLCLSLAFMLFGLTHAERILTRHAGNNKEKRWARSFLSENKTYARFWIWFCRIICAAAALLIISALIDYVLRLSSFHP
jgi:hypothetical protein